MTPRSNGWVRHHYLNVVPGSDAPTVQARNTAGMIAYMGPSNSFNILGTTRGVASIALATVGMLAACGDPSATPIDGRNTDDGASDSGSDSGSDAMATEPVGSSIAVLDLDVIDPEAASGVRGGSITVGFRDLTMNGGTVIFGTTSMGGCLVHEFDATHPPNPSIDSGAVTISGSGLLKTVGPCTFQAALKQYECISNTAAAASGSAQDLFASTGLHDSVAYVFPGLDFGMAPAVDILAISRASSGVVTVTTATAHGFSTGHSVTIANVTDTSFNTPAGPGFRITVVSTTAFTYQTTNTAVASEASGTAAIPSQRVVTSVLNINGFSNAAFNSGASAFPIVSQLSANTVMVINATPADNTVQAPSTVSYKVINGAMPIPTFGSASYFNFLGSETGLVTITKLADSAWQAIDETVYARGQGFDLSDESDDPATFNFTNPATAGINYTCAGTAGNCGADASTAAVEATVISGSATKQNVSALLAFQMPTEVSGTDHWLEWQCVYPSADTATIPTAAVQAIIGFAPTRVEMRVLRVSVTSQGSLVGHGLVGHSDPP